jgi:hypothetical protein
MAIGATLASAALLAVPPTLAHAASRTAASSATTSVTILRPLSVSATAQMSFGKLHYEGAGPATTTVVLSSAPPVTRTSANAQLLPNGGETPAIRQISGEPSRAYTVTAPATISSPGGFAVNHYTFWTANSGDITSNGVGHLSASGADTLRVGATLTVPNGAQNNTFTANPTITISYQ